MKLFNFLIAVFFLTNAVCAQSQPNFQVEFQSLASTGNHLPFWLVHNQQGKYNALNTHNQIAIIDGYFRTEGLLSNKLDIELATKMVANYSSEFDFHFNELFAKAYLWGWKLEGGLFHEPVYFYNLSSTNGNIDRSNNNRPYPRVRFGTDEFIPFLFWKNWFSFKAEYDEGILNDERVVKKTRLHHKSLYVKAKVANKVNASFGLNHYVMWGGISPTYGELPSSFNDYITYVTGGAGTSNFPETDQYNVAGNQLGSYHLQIDFPILKQKMSIYISHPFEDHSGMEFDNRRDNLYGVFVDFGENKIIEKLVYEHMYTKHQSGNIHQYGFMRGRDNYFNHGYYNNGFTYKGYTLASPLFTLNNEYLLNNSNSTGIANNRISMHHIGLSGKLTKQIYWNGMFTYSTNLGTYDVTFEPIKNQFSMLINLVYPESKLPFDLKFSLASDFGQLYENRIGGLIGISKKW